jgi:hypothetical protein
MLIILLFGSKLIKLCGLVCMAGHSRMLKYNNCLTSRHVPLNEVGAKLGCQLLLFC